MKTFSITPSHIHKEWLLIDAQGQTLGRLASEISRLLRGKHKPRFVPHLDGGDYVIVINADKITLTGQKLQQKMYYRHSGYPGGLKSITAADLLEKKPTEVLKLAVKGMLPRNKLRAVMLKNLKIYAGTEHPHGAQKPKAPPARLASASSPKSA